MKLSKEKKAYIAGFLDGDGSIHVRLKPNSSYRFRFQIAPAIVFYQSKKEINYLKWLKEEMGVGHLRIRKDGIGELTVADINGLKEVIKNISPYLRLKKKQAILMSEILRMKQDVKNAKDFLRLAQKIDKFQELNYSKKRIQNSSKVEETLKKEKLLTP